MKNLVKYVQNINANNALWSNGDTIVIGVSGGPDSMCLLDVMYNISQKTNIKLIIAHVNYGLRGEDSDADTKLVQKIANKYNIICETLVCSKNILQGENEWRNIRYNFFVKILEEYQSQSIAIAHNKNDQVETLLLHLFRGSGLNGLSAMKFKNNNVIRPLLQVQKQDILEYCERNNLQYNIDKTNNDIKFTRNKIRNNLIPYLQNNFNEEIIDILAKTAQNISEDYDLLNKSQKQFWQFNKQSNTIIFEVEDFKMQHMSQQRTSLRIMISQVKGDVVDIQMGFVDELIKAIISTKNKHQEVSSKYLKMHKKGGTVKLVRTN
jgi:tRNA(Ile)-lysidine synthase